MDQKIDAKIKEEILAKLEETSEMETGSEEQLKSADYVAKLHKMQLDASEAEARRQEEEARRKDSKVSMWVGVGTQVGLGVLGWALYAILHMKDLKFEETGTITSQTARNHWGIFKPRVK